MPPLPTKITPKTLPLLFLGLGAALGLGILAAGSVLFESYRYDVAALVGPFLGISQGVLFGLSFIFYRQGQRIDQLGKFLIGAGLGGVVGMPILTSAGLVPGWLGAAPLMGLAAAMGVAGIVLIRAGRPARKLGWMTGLGHLTFLMGVLNAGAVILMLLNFLAIPTRFALPAWLEHPFEDRILDALVQFMRISEVITPSSWLWMNELQIEYFGALAAVASYLVVGVGVVVPGSILFMALETWCRRQNMGPSKVLIFSTMLLLLSAGAADTWDAKPALLKSPTQIRILNLSSARATVAYQALARLRREHIQDIRGVMGYEGARSSRTRYPEKMDINLLQRVILIPHHIPIGQIEPSLAHSVGEYWHAHLTERQAREWKNLHEKSLALFKGDRSKDLDRYFAPQMRAYLESTHLNDEDFHTMWEQYHVSSTHFLRQAFRGDPSLLDKQIFLIREFFVVDHAGQRALWLYRDDGSPALVPIPKNGPITPALLKRVLNRPVGK